MTSRYRTLQNHWSFLQTFPSLISEFGALELSKIAFQSANCLAVSSDKYKRHISARLTAFFLCCDPLAILLSVTITTCPQHRPVSEPPLSPELSLVCPFSQHSDRIPSSYYLSATNASGIFQISPRCSFAHSSAPLSSPSPSCSPSLRSRQASFLPGPRRG